MIRCGVSAANVTRRSLACSLKRGLDSWLVRGGVRNCGNRYCIGNGCSSGRDQQGGSGADRSSERLDWKTYAAHLHPDELRNFRALFDPALKAVGKKDAATQRRLLAMFESLKDLRALRAEEFFMPLG